MSDQPRPGQPESGQDPGDAVPGDDGSQTVGKPAEAVPGPEHRGKSRQTYLDPGGSKSTRDIRDTARRRRDAEEKLQQHLMEAKSHTPNEYHHHEQHHAEQPHGVGQHGERDGE
ncbi:hypothetical protein [Pseudarthrobacter sp. NamE5]|uniref:hypothetical protein n=1 Tax=Pseudarthrobacter sp. NamE5 TaxID=2576839 RepID=UPI00110B35C6|nr:hypothetical protein [Pseudarthrobacter sp. NamE5]TLM87966.1 hypothetical protein FDW84_00045 [Pseudarthrobacter sp. NamE5]